MELTWPGQWPGQWPVASGQGGPDQAIFSLSLSDL